MTTFNATAKHQAATNVVVAGLRAISGDVRPMPAPASLHVSFMGLIGNECEKCVVGSEYQWNFDDIRPRALGVGMQ